MRSDKFLYCIAQQKTGRADTEAVDPDRPMPGLRRRRGER